MTYAVEFRGLTKSFDGFYANRAIDLRVTQGTIHALMGEAVAGNPLPRPLPTSAIVSPGRYTTVTVEYDSGIR